jgi:colicin import membrane protein
VNTQSSGAYLLSLLLHGAAALVILLFAYASSRVSDDSPKVFELVAGAGDNYAATAAPALGSRGGIKITAATPPVPAQAAPVQPSPIQPAPMEAVPSSAPAKQPKPVDLVAQLKRVEERREKRMEAKYKKEEEAEAKKQEAADKAAAKVAHIDAEGIREGVIGGSTDNTKGGAGGKALTREEGSELDAYFSMLRDRIKENAVQLDGVSDKLEARVEFFLAADGSISNVRILESSGNAEFDRSAVDAVRQTRSMPPRPDGKSDTRTVIYKLHSDDPP